MINCLCKRNTGTTRGLNLWLFHTQRFGKNKTRKVSDGAYRVQTYAVSPHFEVAESIICIMLPRSPGHDLGFYPTPMPNCISWTKLFNQNICTRTHISELGHTFAQRSRPSPFPLFY